MFLLYISLIYLLIYRSYDAFNADDLDKTSRQKRQFEKVIIPILWEIHRTNVLQKLSLCSAEDILRFLDWFRDLLKIEHFAWTIYNKWILLDCSRVCKNLTNGQNLLKFWHNISVTISNVFVIHFSYLSFNVQELWCLQCGWYGLKPLGKNVNLKRS